MLGAVTHRGCPPAPLEEVGTPPAAPSPRTAEARGPPSDVRGRSPWSPGAAVPGVVGLPLPLRRAERDTGLPLSPSRTHGCFEATPSGQAHRSSGDPAGRPSSHPWGEPQSVPAARLAHRPPHAPAGPAPPLCSLACSGFCLHGVPRGRSGAAGRARGLHPPRATGSLREAARCGCLRPASLPPVGSGK